MFKHPQCKNFVEYLGEFINNNLSWKNHVDYIVLKMSKTVVIGDLQIRLRLRVLQCVPGAHARLPEAVTSTRSVVFNKSRPPTTSSLQVQRRVKRLVFKRADTL